MAKLITLTILFSICCNVAAQAQLDSIQKLDEVVLSDVKLKRYAIGYKITILNDSVIEKSPASLTDLLRFHSHIYFKENGYGMVSSPSFRGTNASQTAVIWNGININSQLNGQVDFNNINSSSYSSVEIRSGGGSVQYGSGAIGGSVHLSNNLSFSKHLNQRLQIGYGSFETRNASYNLSSGSEQWSTDVGISYRDSENDYKYLGTERKNENGQFDNLNFHANGGFILNDRNVFKIYHESFIGDRNFSGTLVAPSKSRYEDENHRSLLEWTYLNTDFTSKFKVAHLYEGFKYFENKEKDFYEQGRVNSIIVNHNLDYKISKSIDLRTILEFDHYIGNGDNFDNPSRSVFSATALLRHQLTEKMSYGLNIRKDFTSDFKSPFVLSTDAKYQFSKHYALKINASKNFRVPTFNDLYWNPGGNLDLKPETSYQIDLGQELIYKSVGFKLNGYYIKTKDLIQWVPDNTGLFRPRNINAVQGYGSEFEMTLKRDFGLHRTKFETGYSYTVSKDKATENQLNYVPLHKFNLNFDYRFKAFELFYQHIFNGEVSIIGGKVDGFDVGNLGLIYHYNIIKNQESLLQFNINNLFNTSYENVALRPMPNRNYSLKLTLNF